jgi:hypothetical protein
MQSLYFIERGPLSMKEVMGLPHDTLFQAEALDAEWETRGLLFVFLTSSAMEHYAETSQLLRNQFGLGAKMDQRKCLAT